MNGAHDPIFDPAGGTSTPRGMPLASWYTQGTSDGLGDRLLMFDNTAAASLELLRFRPELAGAPGFERALRKRVERLARFRHRAFSQVRSVECLDGDTGLTLVSTHVPGKRLREIVRGAQPRGIVYPEFAAWLIRRLAPALADFHAVSDDIAHGSLSADRIVLTPDGRLVIVEHVLGSAIGGLNFPPDRLWRDLGIILPTGLDSVTTLDQRADVVQLGLVALSMLVGRRVRPNEYPHRLGRLLDEFTEGAGRRSPSLVPPLRLWLEQALQLHGGFGSAIEAAEGAGELPEPVGRELLERGERPTGNHVVRRVPASVSAERAGNHVVGRVLLDPAADHEMPANSIRDLPGSILNPRTQDRAARHPRRFVTVRNLAVAFGLLALVEAAAIGRFVLMPQADPAAAVNVPVKIESPSPADIVLVDGRQAVSSAIELASGSPHVIRVIRREVPAVEEALTGPVTDEGAEARAKAEEQAARALALAAVRQRSGGLRLSSPIELHVLEGERVLGSSENGPIVASAGVHQLDFVNNTVGYRSRQTVEIKAGQIVPLTIRPPDGRLSVNALPWAQVWIDGNPVGETPLANLTVPLGQHEITFRHPQLGEKRETAVVQSGLVTRVSATLGRQ
jgi:hypothetical protein